MISANSCCFFLPKGIVQQVRNDFLEQCAANLDGRISVDLYEPNLKVLVDHEVESEEFKRVFSSVRVKTSVGGLDSVPRIFDELRVDVCVEVDVRPAVDGLYVLVEVVEGYLVASFEFPV